MKYILLTAIVSVAFVARSTLACGNSEYPLGAGVFTSPNYPSNYDGGANCLFFLEANQSTQYATTVQLSFSDFATEACCDFLYVYDGPTVRSPLIRRLMGTYNNISALVFTTTQSYMTLSFITDTANEDRGFNASYRTVIFDRGDCPNSMGYPINNGQLNSTHFPGVYPNNQDCLYAIEAQPGGRLNITFDVFATELNHDYVTIYDGPSQISAVIANLTGHLSPPLTYTSTGQYMTLRFRSDAINVDLGWHAVYSLASATKAETT